MARFQKIISDGKKKVRFAMNKKDGGQTQL